MGIRLVKPRNAPFKLLDLSKALKDINEGIAEAAKGKTKEEDGMEAKSFCDIVSLKTGCIPHGEGGDRIAFFD